MALILQLAGEFPSAVRSNGNEDFRAGKVKIKNGSPWNLEAAIEDADAGNVRIWREGNDISVRCSCSFYSSSGPCKHLWAALLAADSENYLQGGAGGAGRLTLIEESAEEESNDYFADDDDDDNDDYDDDELEDGDDDGEWMDVPSTSSLRDSLKSDFGSFQSQPKKETLNWRENIESER